MAPQMLDDCNLLKACVDGNADAFGALVQKYQSYIRTLTYSATGNLEKSEELAQDVFVIAWRNLAQLRDYTKFKSWLYQITHHEIVKYYKKKKQDIIAHAAPFDTAHTVWASADGPEENALSKERRELIHQALDRIPSHYREPLILFYWEGRSVRQVAQMFDLNEDTAKKRISRARGMLKADVEVMVEDTISKAPSCQRFSAVIVGLVTAGALLKTSTAAAAVITETAGLGTAEGTGVISAMFHGLTAKIITAAAAAIVLTAGSIYVVNQQTKADSSGAVIHTLSAKINTGLVLYFSFDNIRRGSDGTTIIDDSGAGNHGIFKAGMFSAGKFGQAFECIARNKQEGIVVKDSNSLDLDVVTVAAWVKTSQMDDQWNRILDKGWLSAYNLCLGGEYRGQRCQNKTTFECAGCSITSKTLVVDGKWHFIAGTYDGQTQKLYIDGKLDNQWKTEKTVPMKHNDVDIHIGSLAVPEAPPYNEPFFDGLIDEIRLYNRVLSDEEVQELYQYQPAY
jgi:RNA polymerase sigma factor (sigma-70 family)